MKKKFYIIGTGKTGSAFSIELEQAGYNIAFISDKNNDNLKSISKRLNTVSESDKIEKDFISASQVILICVQDRFIKDTANEISSMNLDLNDKYFMHVSGSETTDVFMGKCYNHENLVSMHPIQTFDKLSENNHGLLKHIFFGIEGGKNGKELSKEIAEKLESKIIEIPKDKKNLYHSACVISSNFLITLLNISSELIGSIGIEKSRTFEIFRPIIEKTLKNISENGLINSLTGPFERNDIETISNHLNSINAELPSLIPFYTLLGMETVKVAFKKESLNMKNVINLLDLMNEYIKNESEIFKKTIN